VARFVVTNELEVATSWLCVAFFGTAMFHPHHSVINKCEHAAMLTKRGPRQQHISLQTPVALPLLPADLHAKQSKPSSTHRPLPTRGALVSKNSRWGSGSHVSGEQGQLEGVVFVRIGWHSRSRQVSGFCLGLPVGPRFLKLA